MNKQEFLAQLRKGLSGSPQADIEERLTFYSEMIDDRIEDGLSEEEAIRQIGPIDPLIAQSAADAPAKKAKPKRRLRIWEILLLVLGSPVWLSLLIAAFAVVLSLYAALWAVFVSLAGSAVGCVAAGIVFLCCGDVLPGFAAIGAGLFCAGLSIFMFHACKAATKGGWRLARKCLVKKEGA